MDFLSHLLSSFISLSADVTGSLFDGVPAGGLDCTGGNPVDVYPDGTPVEVPPLCDGN